ncbi:hypothetical protein [Bacillus velezensis]|uniref:hypothetical protein n=1 Tax=Bacillus velezensis TaxID=492670 RepID=UPI000980BDE4|nr:hypothetical protein [Bacillus velezensis]MDK4204415.1 hypothetical protein [Bacillus velezensis]WPB64754.1 hypothetical protein SBK94_09895 [Bacillus velezensis]
MNQAVNAERFELALEDMNYEWSMVQLKKVVQYWHDGKSILDMSELLNRDSDEIILLVMDFARKNILPARKNGLRANNRIRISEKTMKEKMDRLRYLFEESPVYIPFQELNFMFYDSEIRHFRELWAANESYLNIAKELKRNEDETLFLIIDQAKRDLIEPRESG